MPGMDRLALLETGFESYPVDYITHNVPLIVLSGLDTPEAQDESQVPERYREGSLRVGSEEFPLITGKMATDLLETFQKYNKTDEQWNSRPVVDGSTVTGFKFKAVGRTYQLLPRKAKPPTLDSGYEPPGSPDSRSPPHWILHSPISPLTPGSPLFPDGVMTAEWITKHQQYIPSVFMTFFEFSTDPARNSLLDNQLKTEINNIKATLYRSEYKTKLVVVLLSDTNIHDAPDIEDRLANIRRATGLDSKTAFFFLPPNVSTVEIQAFVDSILVALQPGCVEYYRDLTKHARRKKNRGNVPAPTAPPTRGTSQTLPAFGWGVRYDFKLGVFAEFRQEMESACRHYTAALEALLSPDGIFETTASWSPRWEEARILADIVAMRILRCLLWSNMSTTAVQSWSNYRFRLQEIVDRRGKGSSNYGWEAWESRWPRIMAELVKRSQLPVFQAEDGVEFNVYAPVEKTFPIGERVRPFDHLHHPAYWYRLAAKHGRRRRRLAQDLPEEDCLPPGMSPASAMASRYGTYDTYLCPEPWQEHPNADRKTYNHAKDIFSALSKASGYLRAQPRAFDEDMLDIAREFIRNKQYAQALETLYHLWERMSWRRDQWWDLVFEVTRSLRECAKQLGDGKVLAAADFELYNNILPPMKNQPYNLLQSGTDLSTITESSLIQSDVVELDSRKISSFISTSVTFSSGEGNAGEPLKTQVAITSHAQRGSASVKFDKVEISLKGSPFAISLRHVEGAGSSTDQIQMLSLHEDPADAHFVTANANLELKEGQTSVIEFAVIFREAGPISVETVALSLSTAAAKVKFTSTPEEYISRPVWWKQGHKRVVKAVTAREEGHTVQIQPRPPKMELRLPNINDRFYTDEEIELAIEVLNGEDEATESSLEVRLFTSDGPAAFTWSSSPNASPSEDLPGQLIGPLESGTSKLTSILFAASSLPTTYVVEVKVLYHLLSDPSTPISKIFSSELSVSRAFEANYDFYPRVHPAPWPSFFSPETISTPLVEGKDIGEVNGIAQRWELSARIASFTYEGILMSKVELRQENISNHATSTFTPLGPKRDNEIEEVAPQQQIDRVFQIDVQKSSLEDRRSIELEVVLAISWARPGKDKRDKVFTSLLPVNNFVLENGPRVLASVNYPPLPRSNSTDGEQDSKPEHEVHFAQLTFTLENPTNHFLTFELAMEGPQREEWAFSGMKMRSLNLLPLSRESVSCRILPLAVADAVDEEGEGEGKWLEIRYRVMDVYFRKVLRCLPAGAGVREVEGKGGSLLVWVGGLRSV